MPTLSIERREVAAQPFLFVRARASREGIAAAVGEGLGKAFGYAQKAGLAPAGPPVVRYPEMAGGTFTLESGVVLAAPAPGEGDVEAGTLQGGPVLVALHAGSYDTLQETYSAMERWAAAHATSFAGAPWESYLTDPGNHPDPADWRTEVYWPLAR